MINTGQSMQSWTGGKASIVRLAHLFQSKTSKSNKLTVQPVSLAKRSPLPMYFLALLPLFGVMATVQTRFVNLKKIFFGSVFPKPVVPSAYVDSISVNSRGLY